MKPFAALLGLFLFILVAAVSLWADTGKAVYGVVWKEQSALNGVKVAPNCSNNYYITAYAAIPQECSGGPYLGDGVFWVDEDHQGIGLCSSNNFLAASINIGGTWWRGLEQNVYMADFPWEPNCPCQRRDITIIANGPLPDCSK